LSQLEYKSIPLKLQDVDKSSRMAVVAHAAYGNIDRAKDISRKGMFNKSWEESRDDVSFYLNHNDTQAPGRVVGLKEDNEFAYTEAKMGTHTLGNDTLIMMDEGIIKNASFGYITMKSLPREIKGQKVRELIEVKHVETSVLTQMPANPKAGVVSVIKSFAGLLETKTLNDQEQAFLQAIIASGSKLVRQALDLADSLDPDADLYTWINYFIQQQSSWIGDAKSNLRWGRKDFEESMKDLKAHAENMERFVRNTKASDECIQNIEAELKAAQHIISLYDTVTTREIDEPGISGKSNGNDEEILLTKLHLLNAKMSVHERGIRSSVRS